MKSQALSLLAFLALTGTSLAQRGPTQEHIVNATGSHTFDAPRYTSEDQPATWTARVAITESHFEFDYYRSSTWLDTPNDVPVNGSSITRDVCLLMRLPVVTRIDPIDYSKGEGGCNDALGEECVEKLRDYLEDVYSDLTAENGTMNCRDIAQTGLWHQKFYELCPVYEEHRNYRSGFELTKLIPSSHERYPLHGDQNGYWLALGNPRNTSEATPEEQYDLLSQLVFTYFIISGPEYDDPDEDPSVQFVCVKAEDPVEGSRELPSAASNLASPKRMFSLTLVLMLVAGWLL